MKYNIATGVGRMARTWRNEEWEWAAIAARCSQTQRTSETVAEYKAMSREEQSRRKDTGGFVGGYLRDGVRKSGNVAFRTLVTLDLDYATATAWKDFTKAWPGVAAVCYSTHSHTPANRRLRLVLPLSRRVSPEEYEPIARRVAERCGMEQFDDTTYQAARLFYWPSTPRDGDFFFQEQQGMPLDADEVLRSYVDYHDVSSWPTSSRVAKVITRQRQKAGDPTEKKGLVGAFCRCYTIEEAIDTFLSDVYTRTRSEGRYTYNAGHVSGGLVCYDHIFAYANNATDPCSGQLCNAFDLVRIHKFGADDDDSQPLSDRKSQKLMEEFAANDAKVRAENVFTKARSAAEEFAGIEDYELDDTRPAWMEELKTRKNGDLLPTIANMELIIDNDKHLKNLVWFNEFTSEICVGGKLPWPHSGTEQWTDADDAQLWAYIEKVYDISHQSKLAAAVSNVAGRRSRHPVKEYFESLAPWDGVQRLEMLIINALGADDTPLARTMTKIHFAAAVRRILDPGCKYDYCLTLVGPEGAAKSSLVKEMGGAWFTDSLNALDSKSAVEQLQHTWLCELAEFAAMKKVEVEQIKAFISRTDDMMRPAYGRHVVNRPRHVVFFGTSNDPTVLRGDNGNRRFWIIPIKPELRKLPTVAATIVEVRRNRDKLWAEALHYARDAEFRLFLDEDMEAQARKLQQEYNISSGDPMREDLRQFIDTLVPANWEDRTLEQRRDWWSDDSPLKALGTLRRDVVSPREFLMEFYGWRRDDNRFYQKSREVGKVLKEWGWKMTGPSRHAAKAYGVQLKGYTRPKDEPE